jgi:hypothetical protein
MLDVVARLRRLEHQSGVGDCQSRDDSDHLMKRLRPGWPLRPGWDSAVLDLMVLAMPVAPRAGRVPIERMRNADRRRGCGAPSKTNPAGRTKNALNLLKLERHRSWPRVGAVLVGDLLPPLRGRVGQDAVGDGGLIEQKLADGEGRQEVAAEGCRRCGRGRLSITY